MPRQTPEQLRVEIVDRAAALFARQGLANTSLQQIADAVGYTKAGLLHYFVSKQAIYDAVIDRMLRQVQRLVAVGLEEPKGQERDRILLAAAVDMTYEWPGIAQLCMNLTNQDEPTRTELVEAGDLLSDAFDLGDASEERTVRTLAATSAVTFTAVTAAHVDRKREWRPLIVDTAMNTLGYL